MLMLDELSYVKFKVHYYIVHWSWCLYSGLELRMTTSTRLKTCLYSFTSPGGPMYPTRAVRHAAWDSLNALFPVSNNVFKKKPFFCGAGGWWRGGINLH